jgi:phospholipid transport system substrate-binding protein
MRHLVAVTILSVLLGSQALAEAASPISVLRRSNDEVRSILRQQKGGGPVSTAQRDRIKHIVNGFLDYEELARRALADNWDKITPAQRKEFVQVFRDLIERNYVKQLRNNVDYQIDYTKEEVKGDDAVVHSVVQASRKGRKSETTIDYKLTAKDGRWGVYDVITDDVSLLSNYRSTFARVINREGGFPALLAKMKKKLAETPE